MHNNCDAIKLNESFVGNFIMEIQGQNKSVGVFFQKKNCL